jgi:hypothetical protein
MVEEGTKAAAAAEAIDSADPRRRDGPLSWMEKGPMRWKGRVVGWAGLG